MPRLSAFRGKRRNKRVAVHRDFKTAAERRADYLAGLAAFKAVLLEGVEVVFIVIAVATFQERFQTMLLRGPTPWMLALTAWHFYGILNAPDSKWALARCLLILIGLSVYIIAGFGLKSDTIRWVATAAIGIGVAQSLLGFAQFGQDQSASRGAISARAVTETTDVDGQQLLRRH